MKYESISLTELKALVNPVQEVTAKKKLTLKVGKIVKRKNGQMGVLVDGIPTGIITIDNLKNGRKRINFKLKNDEFSVKTNETGKITKDIDTEIRMRVAEIIMKQNPDKYVN